MVRLTAAVLIAAAAAHTFADSTSVEFFDPTGAVVTSKVGWKGTAAAGEFFIETPNDGNGVTVKQGEVTANKFIGDGSSLTNLPMPSTEWDSIDGKPGAFPPSAHSHAIGEVTSLQTSLDGKASLSGATFTGAVTVNNDLRIGVNATNATFYDSLGVGSTNVLGLRIPTGAFYVDAGEIRGATDIRAARNLVANQDVLVTRNIQANGTATAASFSGSGSGLTSIPISGVTSLQTSLDAKAGLAGATFTGEVTADGGLRLPANATYASFYDSVGMGNSNVLGLRVPTGTFVVDAGELRSTLDIRALRNVVAQGSVLVTGNVQANGNISASGTCCASDARFKENVEPLANCLDKVQQLQGVSYDWRREEFPEMSFTRDKQIGLIAQQVEDVLPEVVVTRDDGYKALSYDKLTAVLVEAVKEQQAEITALRARLEQLEAQK